MTIPNKPAQVQYAARENLTSMLDIDDATNRFLASYPKASSQMLEKLSHSSDRITRRNVVLNLNADRTVLIKLAPQFPGDFFKNPAFDWLLIEDPNLLFEIGGGVLKNILKRSDCPVSFLKWAVERGSEAERIAVTSNLQVPYELLIELASMGGGIANAAKSHVSYYAIASKMVESETVDLERFYFASRQERASDARFLARLDRISRSLPDPVDIEVSSKSSEWLFRLAVARNKSTPNQTLKILTTDANRNVVLQAQKTIHIKNEQALLVNKLVDSYDGEVSICNFAFMLVQKALVKGIPSPWHLHGTIWSNIFLPVCKRLGTGSFSKCITVPFPTELLTNLAASPEDDVRRFVARNPGTSESILKKLAMDKDIEVRWSVGLNPKTPIELQKELLDSFKKKCVNICHRKVALDGTLSLDVQKSLLKSWRISLFRAAAGDERAGIHPTIDPVLLNIMQRRCGLKEYEYLPDDDYIDWPQYDLSKNHATPTEILRQLADSHESASLVVQNLASNPSTPIEILHRIAKEGDYTIRHRVARNPNVTFNLLKQLKLDNSKLVSTAVNLDSIENRYLYTILIEASDLKTTEDRLVEISRVGYWTVRFAAIQNPSFPARLRESAYSEIVREVSLAIKSGFEKPNFPAVIHNSKIEFSGVDLERLTPEEYLPLMRALDLIPFSDDKKAIFKAAASGNLMDRVGACLHDQTLPSELMILAMDSDILVRQIAIRRLAKIKKMRFLQNDIEILSTLCPKCEGMVKKKEDAFTCIGVTKEMGCGFTFKREYAHRHFSLDEAEELIRDKKIGPLHGFRSKTGSFFTSSMIMKFDENTNAYKVVFDFDKSVEGKTSQIEFSEQQSLGACPKCRGEVYECGSNYLCSNSVSSGMKPNPSCNFKIGNNVLKQPISHEQLKKLLNTGKTDLLDGFFSSRTQKKFKAMLLWDASEGKVNFEFGSTPKR